jgi:hypothetical protein
MNYSSTPDFTIPVTSSPPASTLPILKKFNTKSKYNRHSKYLYDTISDDVIQMINDVSTVKLIAPSDCPTNINTLFRTTVYQLKLDTYNLYNATLEGLDFSKPDTITSLSKHVNNLNYAINKDAVTSGYSIDALSNNVLLTNPTNFIMVIHTFINPTFVEKFHSPFWFDWTMIILFLLYVALAVMVYKAGYKAGLIYGICHNKMILSSERQQSKELNGDSI